MQNIIMLIDVMLGAVVPSSIMLSFDMLYSITLWHEYYDTNTPMCIPGKPIMQNIIMLIVVMLCVVVPSVTMLSITMLYSTSLW
jgi:hypothetical protein